MTNLPCFDHSQDRTQPKNMLTPRMTSVSQLEQRLRAVEAVVNVDGVAPTTPGTLLEGKEVRLHFYYSFYHNKHHSTQGESLVSSLENLTLSWKKIEDKNFRFNVNFWFRTDIIESGHTQHIQTGSFLTSTRAWKT